MNQRSASQDGAWPSAADPVCLGSRRAATSLTGKHVSRVVQGEEGRRGIRQLRLQGSLRGVCSCSMYWRRTVMARRRNYLQNRTATKACRPKASTDTRRLVVPLQNHPTRYTLSCSRAPTRRSLADSSREGVRRLRHRTPTARPQSRGMRSRIRSAGHR